MRTEVTKIDARLSQAYRLGVVSFLNARPLVEGLDSDERVSLTFDVPSRLAAMLDDGRADVALIPVVDLFRGDDELKVVSDACIGSDGRTMTVRIFSRMPAEEVTQLYADLDSHTSVMLSQVIWQEQYGQRLEILPLPGEVPDDAQAVMLIGDKVVQTKLPQMKFDVDLGQAWKDQTGLPFVFAVWAASASRELRELPAILAAARDRGVARAAEIARGQGPDLGWPAELAVEYLSECLRFRLDDRMHESMELFFKLARRHGFCSVDRDLVFA